MDVKYQSRVREMSSDGETTTIVYYGERAEMEALYRDHAVNEQGESGRLKNLRLYQASGSIWEVEMRFEAHQGTSAKAPDTSFGKKSAQLSGAMLNLSLEVRNNYLANWDHYLAAAPTVSSDTAPAWWATATDTLLDFSQSQNYRWVKSPGECPVDADGKWRVIKKPMKKGTTSFDVAVYTITESARFESAAHAGRMVAGKLNKIGTPSETFGITGGNWKCDSANVSWQGKYWLATLTWTRSGDDAGWDRDLYPAV